MPLSYLSGQMSRWSFLKIRTDDPGTIKLLSLGNYSVFGWGFFELVFSVSLAIIVLHLLCTKSRGLFRWSR